MNKPIGRGDIVTHLFFGDGMIDDTRERGDGVEHHVQFTKFAAWIPVRDLTRKVVDDELTDAAAVAHLAQTADDWYDPPGEPKT